MYKISPIFNKKALFFVNKCDSDLMFNLFSVNILVGDLEEALQQNLDSEEKVISVSFQFHSHLIA